MMNILLNVSGKIDTSRFEIIEQVHAQCARLGIPFMLVGALARDIHFAYAHDIRSSRTTMDVDFAVMVRSWDEFRRLSEAMVANDAFTQERGVWHRFFNRNGRVAFDMIPFGDIECPDGAIPWPPDYDCVMSMAGFSDVMQSAQRCRIWENPEIDIRIVSVSGLAVLKLIAWNDNPQRRVKDAEDLLFILDHYVDTGQQERLYESDIMDDPGFDYERASARLLGRDVGSTVSDITRDILLGILGGEGQMRLLAELVQRHPEQGEKILALLQSFERGIREQKKNG